jgi:hypothetical protein
LNACSAATTAGVIRITLNYWPLERLALTTAAIMPKNVVIFSDGTGQRGGLYFDEERTNVYKL